MQVDLLVQVLYRNRNSKKQKGVPNAAAVWMDPHWTGVWCDACESVQKCEIMECYTFVIRGTFFPLPPSRMGESTPIITMCDSLKIHFYQVRTQPPEETVRDFVYSSAFTVLHLDTKGWRMAGAFNYNANEGLSAKRIPNIRILLKVIKMAPVMPNLQLVKVQGPNLQHHRLTIEIGDWLDETFCKLWTLSTTLSNPRTYFRDFCCTLFFPDICKLFDTGGETHLPCWLACYALANALIVNQSIVKPSDFVKHISSPNLIASTKIEEVMRVVKCMLTPWTMCVREGRYWDDTCVGEPVEDQPFPLSFVPTSRDRVFGKDDCEGRASQAQEMRQLLECIYLQAQKEGARSTFEKMTQSGMCRQKLQMPDLMLRQLLQGCIHVGGLLYHKTLEIQTIVGDANVAALTKTAGAKVVGHSFGLLLYKGGEEYMMVENTAWQRRFLNKVDPQYTKDEIAFMREFATQCLGGNRCQMAGSLTKTLERKIYQKLYMGHDKLYFSSPKKEYGITLDEIQTAVTMSIAKVLSELSTEKNFFGCPAKPEAAELLKKYRQVQANIPDIRRAVMPPQKSEDEFEALMRGWEPISEDKLADLKGGGGFWFTIDKAYWPEISQQLKRCIGTKALQIRQHAFIHSVVVCVASVDGLV